MAPTIKVIVVGAGFGGLATAIELTRKGCHVEVFEAVKKLDNKGLRMPVLDRASTKFKQGM
jgi:phytoene dehydrogenase-like protein